MEEVSDVEEASWMKHKKSEMAVETGDIC